MEKAVLVGDKRDSSSLEELERLTETAGARVVEKLPLRIERPTPSLFVGKGQAEKISWIARDKGADLVIFDMTLHPVQQRNLEDLLGVRVIDRNQLIMDIFAQHAHTEEGKLEVELAQLRYLLPRLTGKGRELSDLGGGIGTRGPGEKKLEYDRRRIRERIKTIEKKLLRIMKHRENLRRRRKKLGIPVVAVVGYTNAGKTTFINSLAHTSLPAGDKLFLTLDTRMKRLTFPDGRWLILTDTVGFIRRLPPQLLASFQATLEEVKEADYLIHIIDPLHEEWRKMRETVRDILEDMGVLKKPLMEVVNKIDSLNEWERRRIERSLPEAIFVSSLTGEGLEKVRERLHEWVKEEMEEETVRREGVEEKTAPLTSLFLGNRR